MKKYKIVVLSDLEKSAATTLKSAVSLASIVNGNIEIFSVKKPTDIIGEANQLSAIRTINNQHTIIDRKIKKLIAEATQEQAVKINSSFAFGNVKNEITSFIAEQQPDIVVLGKSKSSPFNFIGDGIIPFVLNIFKGVIMIATDKKALEPSKDISLGTLNNFKSSFDLEFANELMANALKPLKSFKIVKNSNTSEEVVTPTSKNHVEYVFEHGNRSIKNLSNYMSKSNIDLLYIDRAKKDSNSSGKLKMSDIKNVVNTLDVNILMTAE